MRLGGLEQLSTFARTLGVPLSMAGNVSELKRAVNEYRHKKLVLVDTAGMSQSDLELSSQMAHYKEGVPDLKICVVLSSIVQNGVTEEIIRSLSGVPSPRRLSPRQMKPCSSDLFCQVLSNPGCRFPISAMVRTSRKTLNLLHATCSVGASML